MYQVSLRDPSNSVMTATYTQRDTATPSLTVATTNATAGTETTIIVTKNNLINTNIESLYVFNVLEPESKTENLTFEDTGDQITFDYAFNSGLYGVACFYQGYGWALVNQNIEV